MTTRRALTWLLLAAVLVLAGCADWNWKEAVEGWLRHTCCSSDRCSGPPSCGRG